MKPSCSTNEWSEKLLIENRLGRLLNEKELLCSFHRFTLGVGWKQSKVCKHPHHEHQVGKKGASGRPAPVPLILEINHRYNSSVPIGSLLCLST